VWEQCFQMILSQMVINNLKDVANQCVLKIEFETFYIN
jgi:hypothetical protein